MKEYLNKTISVIKEKSKEITWLIPFILMCLWIIDTIASLFNTGFIKIDILFIILLVGKIGILVYNIFIFQKLFIEGKVQHYNRFKTYVGYMVIFIYVFYSLPRLSWEMQGLITEADSLRLWIFGFVSSVYVFVLYWVLRLSKTQFKWGIITQEELDAKKEKKKDKKKKGAPKTPKTPKEHIIENIHVVVQAIISVIIIQHFTIQLYEIPTESMVPTFLVKDRVLVSKIQQGPTIPLTKWHFPTISKLERGEIVIFESPFYKQDNVLKKIFHEFVFYLTLSTVNIDKDEDGEIRKKLIVKRLIGMPGEKIKMIDDMVYIKKRGQKEFEALESIKKYAHTDLYKEPYETLKRILYKPVDSKQRELLDKWDNWKNNVTIAELHKEISDLSGEFEAKMNSVRLEEIQSFFEKLLSITDNNYENNLTQMRKFLEFKGIGTYTDIGALSNNLNPQYLNYLKDSYKRAIFSYDYLLFLDLLKNRGRTGEFKVFLLSTLSDTSKLQDFEENGRKISLKFKILLIRKFIFFINLYLENPETPPNPNLVRNKLITYPEAIDSGELFIYVQNYYDHRNFPEFPIGENNYIPEDKYFLMGDNRYNSLDFRYIHDQENLPFKPLDPNDKYSIVYQSSIDLHLLDQGKILGVGLLRFWPPDRMAIF